MEPAKSSYDNNLIHQFTHSDNSNIYKYILTKSRSIPDAMTDGTILIWRYVIVSINTFILYNYVYQIKFYYPFDIITSAA